MNGKNYLTLAAAGLLLAGCSADNYTVDVKEEVKSDAIGFNFNLPNTTRAGGTIVGSAAAEKLNGEFVVYGTKHTETETASDEKDQAVFTNYVVEYKTNSAGTTESNTANWEYVGKTPYKQDKVSPSILTAEATAPTQTIKYWDYSAKEGYTFTAFAGKDQLGDATSTEGNKIKVTKITGEGVTDESATVYDKGYTVEVNKDADLSKVYYSDRVEVSKTNYGKPVVLTFRNLGTHVRVGFYETVPGYSVKIDKFYYATDGTTAITKFNDMKTESDKEFKAALLNVKKEIGTATNKLTVTYYNDGDLKNQPTVANTGATYTNTLTLGEGITKAEKLAETSATPTWDNSGNYTVVYPNEACTTPMLLRCDYTLTALDGSNETIKVKNARVVVPAEYCKWKPNFAYTYIFKISDKTNGTTDDPDTDPDDDNPHEGLHPITFDAVVVDVADGNQEIISGVTSNSVITYANGSKVTVNGEYKAGEDIYIVDQKTTKDDHTVIKPEGIGNGDKQAQVYKLNKAATESEVVAKLNGTNLDFTMTALGEVEDATAPTIETTVPLSDKTNLNLAAVKFTPIAVSSTETDARDYYAYVYTKTKYEAAQYEEVGSADYNEGTVYYLKYTDSDVYYPASGITSAESFAANKGKLYVVKADGAGTAGEYDVKVITVK